MGKLILGLDLGPNSVGWALVEDHGEDSSQSKIVDLGVRVFPEGVDAFDSSKEVSRSLSGSGHNNQPKCTSTRLTSWNRTLARFN